MRKKVWRSCKHCKSQFYGINKCFCNEQCMHKWFGKGSRTFWATATDDQKRERMINLYEKNVIRKEGCWDWKITLDSKGYSYLRLSRKSIRGHQVSWLIYKGEIPKGKFICHTCDNRKCTNPDHLFIGTAKDNTQDMMKKERNKGYFKKTAKLNEEKVREIKKLLSLGVTCSKLGQKYGVHRATISLIRSGENWKHVTED